MSYLRMHDTRKAKPQAARTAPRVDTPLETEPAEQSHPHVATIAVRARRSPVVSEIAGTTESSERTRSGTLHRPTHGG